MAEGRDDDEWRKRITAKLRQKPNLVLIDNLRQELDSSALAAATTARSWEDRVLGASEMVRLPVRCIWIATGNNPEVSNEIACRLVRIRLDAQMDQPWRRRDFRHQDLTGWVRANRARLVAACLTICRAWIVAGRPNGTRRIGSYETWAEVMGGVLGVAGIEGFLGNLDERLTAADGEGAALRAFVGTWWDRLGPAVVGTGDLLGHALTAEPPLPLGSGGDHSRRVCLGKALGRMRDRVFRLDGITVRVETAGIRHQAQRWRLARIQNGDSSCQVHHLSAAAQHGSAETAAGVPGSDSPTSAAQSNQHRGEDGESGECSSNTYTRTRIRTRVERLGERSSQHPQYSPTSSDDGPCRKESPDECPAEPPAVPNPPAWLDDVP